MKKFNKQNFVASLKANRKKIIVTVCLVVLLVATGCLNYFLTVKSSLKPDEVSKVQNISFFESYRQDRSNTRAEQILILEEVIASSASDQDAIKLAQTKKLNLVDTMDLEFSLENLIKANNFPDCVVTISTNNINIIVQATELSLTDRATITTIAVEQTGRPVADVIVIPYA